MDMCKDEKIYVYLTFFGWKVVGICVLVYRTWKFWRLFIKNTSLWKLWKIVGLNMIRV